MLWDRRTGRYELLAPDAHGCADREGGGGEPVISDNGRYVASTLSVRPSAHRPEQTEIVVVRDRWLRRTIRVSVSYRGGVPNAASYGPAISGDGRFIAYETTASDIVRGDVAGAKGFNGEVLLWDMKTGRTERVGPSVRRFGDETRFPSISGDGRYVSFTGRGAHFVANQLDPTCLDLCHDVPDQVYMFDRLTKHLLLLSASPEGYLGNSSSGFDSNGHSMSADGRYVAFESEATNLAPPDDSVDNLAVGDRSSDIYLWDRLSGKLTRVSLNMAGLPSSGNAQQAAVSPNGQFVAFISRAVDLVAGKTNVRQDPSDPTASQPVFDVYVYDRSSGQMTRASVSTDGTQSDLDAYDPIVSDRGEVTFNSAASTLASGDTNEREYAYIHTVH
jgi:hypothetical protein